jgi:hypothetical protein
MDSEPNLQQAQAQAHWRRLRGQSEHLHPQHQWVFLTIRIKERKEMHLIHITTNILFQDSNHEWLKCKAHKNSLIAPHPPKKNCGCSCYITPLPKNTFSCIIMGENELTVFLVIIGILPSTV